MKQKGIIAASLLLGMVLCYASYRIGVGHGRGLGVHDQDIQTAGGAEQEADAGSAQGSGADDRRIAATGAGAVETVRPSGRAVLDPDPRQAIESEQRERLMRNIEDNLAMPGMNQIIRDQQRVLMADKYGRLIETYQLNDEEAEYFMELLLGRQMLQVDMGMKLMTGMLSDDERDELLQQVDADMKAFEQEIDWFLNSEADSEYFSYFEQTESERAVVNAVVDHLDSAGQPLAEGTDEELVAILFDELQSYPFSVSFEDNGVPDFSRFTDANISTFLQEMDGLRDPVLQQAAGILDPQQLDVFAGSFDQYIAQYDQRLRMVGQLFNPAP